MQCNAIHNDEYYLGFSFLVLLKCLRHFSFWALGCAAPFLHATVYRIQNICQLWGKMWNLAKACRRRLAWSDPSTLPGLTKAGSEGGGGSWLDFFVLAKSTTSLSLWGDVALLGEYTPEYWNNKMEYSFSTHQPVRCQCLCLFVSFLCLLLLVQSIYVFVYCIWWINKCKSSPVFIWTHM